jgi:hypothetical protein
MVGRVSSLTMALVMMASVRLLKPDGWHYHTPNKGATLGYFITKESIAEKGTDKLYLFYFESPEKEWDAAWKTGEQMLKKLIIDLPEKMSV